MLGAARLYDRYCGWLELAVVSVGDCVDVEPVVAPELDEAEPDEPRDVPELDEGLVVAEPEVGELLDPDDVDDVPLPV